MKVAITSGGRELESSIDERFGRCKYFLFVELHSKKVEAVENAAAVLSSGAGAPAAYIVKNHGADAVLTGKIGPTAAEILASSGIPVYMGIKGSVRDSIVKFTEQSLEKVEGPTVHSGFGIDSSASDESRKTGCIQ